jgi:small-conductance mechanosensitive channel
VETTEHLRSVVARLESAADVDDAEMTLANDGRLLLSGVSDTNATLELGQRFSVLNDLKQAWTEGRERLSALVERMTARASECSAALQEIQGQRDLWTRTRETARTEGAPEELIRTVDSTLGDLQRAHDQVLAFRNRVLALQGEATRQLGVCDEVLTRLEQARHQEEKELSTRITMPIWRVAPVEYGHGALLRPIVTESGIEFRIATGFLRRHGSFLLVGFLLFPTLALLIRNAALRSQHWRDSSPETREHLTVLELPYSVAALVTGLTLYALYPYTTRLIFDLVGTLLIIPILRILKRIAHPALMPAIYGAAALRVADRVQDYVATSPLVEQIWLCLTMGVGLIFMLWSVAPARTRGIPFSDRDQRWLTATTWTARLLAFDFGVAFVAGALGYTSFGRFASSTALVVVNAFLGFLVAARVVLGLWELSLGARPLATLRMVKTHRALISRRSATLISLLAVAGWIFTIRGSLARLGLKMDLVWRVATASLSFGSVTISLGDLFLFGVTLWGSVLVSRLLRFALDEEVFPRLRLAHGLSYAIASLIQYAILTIGLLLALATLGFDASRLTVMIGALGVGIGFGLQNVVNNFVSGLILLFERPIKTGDTVQVGAVTGEVKRIGVRSSTLRTSSGAEVIVPNADLVSGSVTNWTLSDRSRRFELPVSVTYGAKPAQVLTMLKEIAKQNPEVLAHPEPDALLLGFGDSALNFELRAWVADGSRSAAVKSEVALAVSEAMEAANISPKKP